MSNANGLTKENLLSTFPVGLRENPSIAALGDVTMEALAKRPAEIALLSIYPRIDELPETLLDILAYDFKVDWWDSEYTLEEKRRTLKGSWYVHKHMGTKAAVETALKAIYPKARVEEWFEYGGEPYHFRLYLDVQDGSFDSEKHKRVVQRTVFYKNLRSWLDVVLYELPPIVFMESAGDFRLHRLTLSTSFLNARHSVVRFNGEADFGGGIQFTQADNGIFMPQFRVSTSFMEPVRAKMVLFNGEADFGGGIQFNQTASGLRLSAMWIFARFGLARDSPAMNRLRIRSAFSALPRVARFRHMAVSSGFTRNPIGGLGGTVTVDNWRSFDGTISFDGFRRFDAQITQEVL